MGFITLLEIPGTEFVMGVLYMAKPADGKPKHKILSLGGNLPILATL